MDISMGKSGEAQQNQIYRFDIKIPVEHAISQQRIESISKELEKLVKQHINEAHLELKHRGKMKVGVTVTNNKPTTNEIVEAMKKHNLTYKKALQMLIEKAAEKESHKE